MSIGNKVKKKKKDWNETFTENITIMSVLLTWE